MARLPALVLLALATVASAVGAPLPAVDDPPVYAPTPEERAERAAELLAAATRRELFPYYHVPASVLSNPSDAADPVQSKSLLDPDAMLRTFRGNEGDANAPKQVFDRFLDQVVNQAVQDGSHGEVVARAIHDTDWGDRLIKATVDLLDTQGADAPKAIKQLLKRGPQDGIGMEYAKLMWMARDLLVRRSLDGVMARLYERHPGMRFEINILDSGSYESIGSDIDKTLHVVAWDADGNQVRAFGPGGQVWGNDIEGFIRMVYTQFNALGESEAVGATRPLNLSLDTEFFRSDTMARRHSFGATHGTSTDPINISAERLRASFAALQTNPGPSYQFDGKVDTQVPGRAVETDARLQGELEALIERRGTIDRLSGDDVRALLLDEMLRSVHSPAISVSEGADGLTFRNLDVVAFLERNNLTIRYDPVQAAENAAGDYEKLRHKRHKIIRPNGSFDDATYELYRNDIVKYGSRTMFDAATVFFTDTAENLPRAFGEFARRFGPENARARFRLDADPQNMREFTYEVYREFMLPAIERMYRSRGLDGPETRSLIAADLALIWAAHQVNETGWAIKTDPSLEDSNSPRYSYPPEELYRPLLEYMDAHEVVVVPEGAEGQEAARLEHAKRLHLDASERMGILLTAEYLPRLVDRWLGGQADTDFRALYIDELEAGQRRILRLQGELDELQRRPAPDDEIETRRRVDDIETLRERITTAQQEVLHMSANPEQWRADKVLAGHDVVRRIVELFAIQGNDPALRQILDSLPPRYRSDVEFMTQVWAGLAEEGVLREMARRQQLQPDTFTRARAWSADVATRLAHGYTETFGVDLASLRAAGGGIGVGDNSPHRLLGRFMARNYVNMGLADSALRILRAVQQSDGMPAEARMEFLSEAIGAEAIGPIPAVGPLFAMYSGYRVGDPVMAAGGSLQLATEMMTLLSDPSTASMAGTYLVLALSMARTSVEIVGDAFFEPIRDRHFQMAYRGYVNPQDWSLFSGIQGGENRTRVAPVLPILEPDGPGPWAFLYLTPAQTQRLRDELEADGQRDASTALLRMVDRGREGEGGLDENLGDRVDDASLMAVETGDPAPLVIDLATDFDALIASSASQAERAAAGLNVDGAARLQQAVDTATRIWTEHALVKRAVTARILTDRERRRDIDDRVNLWLIASRQNLALELGEQMDRQGQLLYASLVGDPDAEGTLAAEEAEAWDRWKALAPSHLGEEAAREEFLSVMRPPVAYRQRTGLIAAELAEADEPDFSNASWATQLGVAIGRALRESAGSGGITTVDPFTLAGQAIGQRAAIWMGAEDPAEAQSQARRQLQQQAANLAAFVSNSFVDRPGSTPGDVYTLPEATAWFGQSIREKQLQLARLSKSDLGSGESFGEAAGALRLELAELQAEHAFVMGAFAEADDLVAPRVAHLLMLDWVDGRDPYADEIQTALDFVWHDADTQARIRQAVAADLAVGRRLATIYRAHASAVGGLLDLALARAQLESQRLAEDAIRQRTREAAIRVLDKGDPGIDVSRVFGGDLVLQAEPYLMLEGGEVQIAVDHRVDHDVYRAIEVELGWDYDVLSPEHLDDIFGAEAVERALEGLGVTSARAAAPFKEIEYTGVLPRSDGHLLLIPGKVDRPVVPADPVLDICALSADAPEDLAEENAIDFCDTSITQPTRFDRVAVFFTPERDLRIPSYDQQLFAWRIWHESDRTLRSGHFVGDRLAEEEYATYSANVVPLAKEGSPGAFAVILPEWERIPESGYDRRGLGPGVYTVQTRRTRFNAGSGVFGQGDPGIYYDSEAEPDWRDEMTFEIFDASLKFRGFVTEQVKEAVWPEVPGIWTGQFTLLDPQVAGTTVTLGAEATWQEIAADPGDTTTTWYADPEQQAQTDVREDDATRAPPRPDPEVHRLESQLTMKFPEEMLPGHELMGQVNVQLRGEPQDPFVLVAGMHLLVPGSGEPPDRHLAQGETSLPGPWAEEGLLSDEYCVGSADQFDQSVASANPPGVEVPWVWPRLSYWYRCTERAVRSIDATVTLRGGEPDLRAGAPARTLGHLLHDESTLWVLPVFFQLSDGAGLTTPGEGLKMRAYGYAIYGSEATAYAGATPRDGPQTGEGREPVADADDDADDGTGDDDATDQATDPATGDPNAGDPATGDPGTGDPDAGDPDADRDTDPGNDPDTDTPPPGGIVPSDPDTAALIREWITVARPPDNVIAGADVRYNHRGRMIGTMPGGTIRHPEADNLAFDPTYLWVNFRVNDSVDHCTMEEFVQARVAGESTANCAGRYREVVDVVGQPAADARSQLQAEGMQVDVRVVEAAPSAELAYTVADQKPGARTAAARGSRIEIGVYGEHSAALTAPDVIGLPAAEARDRLEAAGLAAEVVIGDEAPAADHAYSVYDQKPGPGVGLEAGGTVQLSIYSDYRPRTRVPYLAGNTVQEARRQLTDLGLSPVDGETVPAYSNESEGLVADTRPGEGVEVDRGTEVQLLTYGQFTHPRCEELLRDGRGEASSGNLGRARSLLVEARDLDCPSAGIDAAIADLDDRIAQRDRCNALVAQAGQQEQAGNLQGALATYRQALSGGCTNAGLSDAIARIDSTIRDQQQRERERLERERLERDNRITVPHWVLVETRINPTREPTEFVVGVTPNFYSARNNGSFRRWSVGETSMTYSSRWQDHGNLELDVSIGVDFARPPAQLVPGQTVNLSAAFSHRGTVNSGNPGIAFEYRGDGIGVTGPTGHTYAPWAAEFRGVSSISPSFQAPPVHGGQITLTAFLWNCGACNVAWVYEARQPEPPPPPVNTIVPPVDTDTGTRGPFSVVVGVYLPFNQQDAGTGDARGAIESRLNDVSQWVRAIPLMLDIGGDAGRAYSRSAFTPGSRWSMPIGVQAQLNDGQSGTMNGALLLEVIGVYDHPDAAMAAQPAVQQAGDPLRFRSGDGRMRQQLDRDGNASTITGGPLQTGWSPQAQQGARQLLLDMMQNFDLCFVATAVYESREGEPLDRLRRFRDEVLLGSPAGRRLAMLYYRRGPALAGWVNRNPAIRPLLRPVADVLGSVLGTVAGNPTLRAAFDTALRAVSPTFDPLPLDPGRPAAARSFSPWPLPWLQPPNDDDPAQESSR